MNGVKGEKYNVEMVLGHLIKNFGPLFKILLLKGINLGFSKRHERVSHRLFVFAILVHEFQVKKQGGLLNQIA